MIADFKTAWRDIINNRWFTVVTVFTLALGVGANTAIFSVVNRLLLNPLPYQDSDRLVYLNLGSQQFQFVIGTPALVANTWYEHARSLDGLEAYSFRDVLTYDENGARVLRGMRITPGLPALLGVAPLLGRGFAPADGAPGATAVIMLSYKAWQRDYGRAGDVLGRALMLDGVPHVVVGVLPPRWDAFVRAQRPDVLFPLSLDNPASSPNEFFEVLGRVRPGLTIDAVTNELDALLKTALEMAPPLPGNGTLTTRLRRPSDRIDGRTRDALVVLLGAVGLLLLVACSNVANLLLARGASRARELTLRSAFGASTWRLVRALFAECLVLALAGGVVGGAFGWLTLRVLLRLGPDSLPELSEVQLDPTVLAFTCGVSLVTALLFGVAPAVQVMSRSFGNALRHGASGVARNTSGPRLRRLLVAVQMAISVVLLVSAGLLVRSVIYLQAVDVGFDTQNLFSAELSLPRARYQAPTSRDAISDQLLERIRSSFGVAAATQAFSAPPNQVTTSGLFEIRGMTLSDIDARAPRPFNYVRPDYFTTLGIPLIEGRSFTPDELRNGTALVINRTAAEHFWPNESALGAEVRWGGNWLPVVGIVEDVVSGGLMQRRDVPQYYLPINAARMGTAAGARNLTLIVRALGDPAIAIGSVRTAIRELDPEIAIRNVLLTETALASSIDAPRFNMVLLTAFAATALMLAAIGLAALIGYEVAARTHEFGVRVALGARTAGIRLLAMKYGLMPAFGGVVVGVVGSLGATQLATSLLYGVEPRDPLTLICVVVLLMLVGLGASLVPARRATRVDPIVALRAD